MDRATISFSGARAAYVGPSLALAPHRNTVAMAALALEAPFELTLRAPTPRPARIVTAALIAPGVTHHLRCRGPMAFVYLDALGDDAAALDDDLLMASLPRVRRLAPNAGVDALCAAIGLSRRAVIDTRIAEIARALDADPQHFAHVADAAQAARLSPSHFQARFRRATGLAFRRYRVWRRMAHVVRAAAAGGSLTEAALDAGFASSAHMNAAFKTMFGLSPSALLAARPRIATPLASVA